MENKDTINKYPVIFVRQIPQEQTVYLESKHSVNDIIDWFENVGLPPEQPHRYSKNDDKDPISVDLIKNELTEEGWKSTDGGSIRRDVGLRPSLKESYLDEYYFESVPSTEGFDGKYDQQIDEYLREKPKKERKGFLKNQRNTLRGLNSDIEELRSNVLRQMEYMSEGLSTDDYSQMDKTEKKLVDDYYKISPYLNPLELKNYNS